MPGGAVNVVILDGGGRGYRDRHVKGGGRVRHHGRHGCVRAADPRFCIVDANFDRVCNACAGIEGLTKELRASPAARLRSFGSKAAALETLEAEVG